MEATATAAEVERLTARLDNVFLHLGRNEEKIESTRAAVREIQGELRDQMADVRGQLAELRGAVDAVLQTAIAIRDKVNGK